MTPEQVVAALGPFIVFGVVFLVRKFVAPNVPGWIITTAVVPILSALVAWAQGMVGAAVGESWLVQTGWNLLAVFIREFVTQLKAGNTQ